jgi:predicted transcriptional regulator
VFDERVSAAGAMRSWLAVVPSARKSMSKVKRAVLDIVKTLADDCTLEDVQYQLYVRQKIERSMQAVAAGRVHSHEQVKKRLAKWLAR